MYIKEMNVFVRLRRKLSTFFTSSQASITRAYDLWSIYYDNQPENLMLDLDELIFSQLLNMVNIRGSIVVDVGCGTGRHWKKILAYKPLSICGYDISPGMLKILRSKFPGASVYQYNGVQLKHTESDSCDVLINTLTIAHMEDLEKVFKEWSRILKENAKLILTDYHPDALAKGAKRTFSNKGRVIPIKNYIHPIENIISIANKFNLKLVERIEKTIDDSVRHYYENQNAIALFEKFKGTSVIYGLILKKVNDNIRSQNNRI